jgi:hypothetical protein
VKIDDKGIFSAVAYGEEIESETLSGLTAEATRILNALVADTPMTFGVKQVNYHAGSLHGLLPVLRTTTPIETANGLGYFYQHADMEGKVEEGSRFIKFQKWEPTWGFSPMTPELLREFKLAMAYLTVNRQVTALVATSLKSAEGAVKIIEKKDPLVPEDFSKARVAMETHVRDTIIALTGLLSELERHKKTLGQGTLQGPDPEAT